ncbi:hypothetical protein EDP1_3985 [Pseudomonas putida S610]|nr:hypothetical protein EDP1_3985 [Pseudomonas putida S610]
MRRGVLGSEVRLQIRRFQALREFVQLGVDVIELGGELLRAWRIVLQGQVKVGRQVEIGGRVEGRYRFGRTWPSVIRTTRSLRFTHVQVEIRQVLGWLGFSAGLRQQGLEVCIGRILHLGACGERLIGQVASRCRGLGRRLVQAQVEVIIQRRIIQLGSIEGRNIVEGIRLEGLCIRLSCPCR